MLCRYIFRAKFVEPEQFQDAAPEDVLGTLVVLHARARAGVPREVVVVRLLDPVMGEERRLH